VLLGVWAPMELRVLSFNELAGFESELDAKLDREIVYSLIDWV
jgi:hypothetical protein